MARAGFDPSWRVSLFWVARISVATYWIFPHLFLSFPAVLAGALADRDAGLSHFVGAGARTGLSDVLFSPLRATVSRAQVAWRCISNGAAFGFAHIIFGNIIAVLGSMVVGWLLAYRYYETRSFLAVWVEHSLYGCLIFTVGLGRFFFTGISNL